MSSTRCRHRARATRLLESPFWTLFFCRVCLCSSRPSYLSSSTFSNKWCVHLSPAYETLYLIRVFPEPPVSACTYLVSEYNRLLLLLHRKRRSMIRNVDSYSAIIDLLSVRAKACWGQNEEETMAGNYNKIVTLPQRVELQRKGRAETSRPLYTTIWYDGGRESRVRASTGSSTKVSIMIQPTGGIVSSWRRILLARLICMQHTHTRPRSSCRDPIHLAVKAITAGTALERLHCVKCPPVIFDWPKTSFASDISLIISHWSL